MNQKLKFWFENGKIMEALCGHDEYFISNQTYTDHHDQLLVIGQLLEWSVPEHIELAAKGFEAAMTKLFEDREIENAIRLFLCYGIKKKSGGLIPVNEKKLEILIEENVNANADMFVERENLRNLLINLISYFPDLGKRLGINKSFTTTGRFEMKL